MAANRALRAAINFTSSLGQELGELITPLSCAGCGFYGQSLCAECWLDWQIGAMRVEKQVPAFGERAQIPIWAAAVYERAVRQTIVSIKERARGDVLNVIPGAAMRLAERIGPHLSQVCPAVTIVPVPGRKPGWLSGREVDFPKYIADHFADALAKRGVESRQADVLRHHRFTRDQVGLGRAQRMQNRGGTMRLRGGITAKRLAPILVVDDVVTTGATLREAIDALANAGAPVIGAVVLAATPRRNPLPEVG